ncbi:hypothetical protein ACXU4B_04570 [Dyella soli]|uniref:Uncharacterized protein n=1 Tax=Dyella soli TaxID=522319 RepID=A0A4R0YUT7_9GAMM|nr:hypothetical protein [Dyella soli]TCI10292.1 hypothetical protein EZM97_15455 [Dyella soli]
MELNFCVVDEQGEPLDVFCEVHARGGHVHWRAWVYGFASLKDSFEGNAFDESAIAGQVQTEVLLRGIRAAD